MNEELKTYYVVNRSDISIAKVLAKQISDNTIEWEITSQIFQGIDKPYWHETHREAVKHLIICIEDEMLKLVNEIERLQHILIYIDIAEGVRS